MTIGYEKQESAKKGYLRRIIWHGCAKSPLAEFQSAGNKHLGIGDSEQDRGFLVTSQPIESSGKTLVLERCLLVTCVFVQVFLPHSMQLLDLVLTIVMFLKGEIFKKKSLIIALCN